MNTETKYLFEGYQKELSSALKEYYLKENTQIVILFKAASDYLADCDYINALSKYELAFFKLNNLINTIQIQSIPFHKDLFNDN